MPNLLSRSQALQVLRTTTLVVADAASLLNGNTVDGSVARLVSSTLTAVLVQLSETEAFLLSLRGPPIPASPETSPRGGPGAAAPKPAGLNTGTDGAQTPTVGHPQETPPHEQMEEPSDWAEDFSQSLDYIEEPDDLAVEDAICGP